MVEPRDYQKFLRESAAAQASARAPGMRGLASLLPAPPPAATLWSQGGLLIASAVLPAFLWLLGKLDPLDVILLYLAEGTSYGLAVIARILLTAAPPTGGERPRAVTALSYAFWWGIVWGGLALAAVACVSPKAGGASMSEWLSSLLVRFGATPMWMAAAATTALLWLDVVRRSDYVDAYLELGPRTTAHYGYVYPMALAFLLGSALFLRIVLQGDSLDASHGLIPAAFLALWLIGWRVLLQLMNLTLPFWGRGLARFEHRFEREVTEAKRRGLD